MISKLTSMLRKIVGRIRKMAKSEYFMIIVALFIPLGLLLSLQDEKYKIVAFIFLFAGLAAWVFGIYALRLEEKQKEADRRVTNNIVHALLTELRGLREDIKNFSRKEDKK
ncbi:hypothetical protein ACFLXK_02935 [Chloroflexota bacterium]